MDDQPLFDELLHAAARLGIEVRIEPFATPAILGGGLCIVRGATLVLIDQRAPLPDRLLALARALVELQSGPSTWPRRLGSSSRQSGTTGLLTLKELVHRRPRAEVAGRALGVRLQSVEARGPEDLDRAFSDMVRARAGGR
jgi:hypothetical protein